MKGLQLAATGSFFSAVSLKDSISRPAHSFLYSILNSIPTIVFKEKEKMIQYSFKNLPKKNLEACCPTWKPLANSHLVVECLWYVYTELYVEITMLLDIVEKYVTEVNFICFHLSVLVTRKIKIYVRYIMFIYNVMLFNISHNNAWYTTYKQNTGLKSEFGLSCSAVCPWAIHHTPFSLNYFPNFYKERTRLKIFF